MPLLGQINAQKIKAAGAAAVREYEAAPGAAEKPRDQNIRECVNAIVCTATEISVPTSILRLMDR